jgi:3-phosphoshikimate 1-carboxyvinyltransferase
MKIQPANSLNGVIQLPGDKSISHRAAIFAAMATGETRIENFATSADCASTLNCLKNLGVEIRQENSTVYIKGVGKTGFSKPSEELDCGNSGTTMRLLAGVLAGQNFDSILTGDESLSRRPMKRIIEPLTQMGAKIESVNGCSPLKIYGANPLQPISYKLPVASAQVKSCILLAGLNAEGKSEIRNPESKIERPTSRIHTELMLRDLGAEIEERFVETENGLCRKYILTETRRSTLKI